MTLSVLQSLTPFHRLSFPNQTIWWLFETKSKKIAHPLFGGGLFAPLYSPYSVFHERGNPFLEWSNLFLCSGPEGSAVSHFSSLLGFCIKEIVLRSSTTYICDGWQAKRYRALCPGPGTLGLPLFFTPLRTASSTRVREPPAGTWRWVQSSPSSA